MFQFRRFPTCAYFVQRTLTEYCSAGFPHSEIHGSMDICSSPWLIAACHVLRRLLMPRHSPCALYSLTLCPPIHLLQQIRKILGSLLRIMQALQEILLWLNCIYPTSFQMRSTIKTYLGLFPIQDLSVALHCHFFFFVQFSRCSL